MTDRISLADVHDALSRSGYLLESRLEAHLRKQEFRVVANEAYPDPETGKARELDLWASYARCWPTGPQNTDNISFEIVAECINPPQPIAFITREWPERLFEVTDRWDALKVGGDPLHVPKNQLATNWTFLASVLRMSRYHHYATKRIATQYCSFEKKKGSHEWMAKHRDEDYATFRKICDATAHHQRELFNFIIPSTGEYDLFLNFVYPVLVVQGALYEVKGDAKHLEVEEASHVQFRCSQLYGGSQQDFQIDVVTEDYFPTFVEMLGEEMDKTANRMRRRHREFRDLLQTRIVNSRRFELGGQSFSLDTSPK